MSSVELRGVRKNFGKHEVLHGVDLTISSGEFVALVGPSGCGKSTILRIIAGLEDLSAGEVLIDGESAQQLSPQKRNLAMVFQNYSLYPHMTVAENMSFGLRLAGIPKRSYASKVRAAAQLLDIEPLLDRKPRELSGGQSQRVAIGRAIVRQPRAFLFDEPLSNLDAALRVQMRAELVRLHRELRTTMIYVTHDQMEAMTMADQIVVLNRGTVEQIGSPLELYREPASVFVAAFLGSPQMNLLRASPRFSDYFDGHKNATTLGIRPEHVSLQADGELEGTVEMREQLGSHTILHVRLPAQDMLVVQMPGDCSVAERTPVRLRIPKERCLFFDAEGKRITRNEALLSGPHA